MQYSSQTSVKFSCEIVSGNSSLTQTDRPDTRDAVLSATRPPNNCKICRLHGYRGRIRIYVNDKHYVRPRIVQRSAMVIVHRGISSLNLSI